MLQKILKCLLLGVAVEALCIVALPLNEANAQKQAAVTKFNNNKGSSYVSSPLEAEEIAAIEAEDTSYEEMITKAVHLHNFVRLIDTQLDQAKSFEFAVKDKKVDEELIVDFDACQVSLLAPYFKKPDELWQRLKDKAEDLLQVYNVEHIEEIADVEDRIAKAMAMSDDEREKELHDEKKLSKEMTVDEVLSNFVDSAVEWQIGFIVLNSFYPNQDAWAERLTDKTHSLPLWEDQKYLYNRDVWKKKYQDIVDHCKKQEKKLKIQEPTIADEYKYDYYFYDVVKQKHSSFCTYVENVEGCILNKDLRKPPEKAPAPLPPVYEEIMVLPHSPVAEKGLTAFPENEKIPVTIQQGSEIIGVYPQAPKNPVQFDRSVFTDKEIQSISEITDAKGKVVKDTTPAFVDKTLWEVYKKEIRPDNVKSMYKKMPKGSEFKIYFDDKLRLNKDIMREDLDSVGNLKEASLQRQDNRISKYFQLKNTAEVSKMVYQSYLDGRDELAESLKDFIETYELNIPDDLDYLKVSDLEKLKKTVMDKRNSFISEAKAILGEKANQLDSLTIEELKEDKYLAFLRALEKDKNAKVLLTRDAAEDIEAAIKNAEADQALLDEYTAASDEIKDKMLRAKNHKFDTKTCIKPSGTVLVNLKTVKIE